MSGITDEIRREVSNDDYMEDANVILFLECEEGNIRGTIRIPKGTRLTDYLNETAKRFIPVTNISSNDKNNAMYRDNNIVIIQIDKISKIIPV